MNPRAAQERRESDAEFRREPADSPCPLCRESRARLRFREGVHSVQDCVQCGVTYVRPRRAAGALISEVYAPDYWRSERPRERGYGDYAADAALHARTFRRRWSALRERLPAAGRALDVGCADGSFLQLLGEHGWTVHGVEPSAAMSVRAGSKLGPECVQTTTLREARLDGERFDLITLWDVLEHLPSPIDDLRRVRSLLAPGGKVVIETQDISSPMAKLCGRRWHHFKHDEHLVHFTPATLATACELAGLRIVYVGRKAAGKYVRGSFLVERSARLHERLPALLRPFLGGDWSVYVNPMDEIIAIAEAQA